MGVCCLGIFLPITQVLGLIKTNWFYLSSIKTNCSNVVGGFERVCFVCLFCRSVCVGFKDLLMVLPWFLFPQCP